MKILRVIPSVNPAAGGPINGLVNTTDILISRGYQVDIAALDEPNSSWVRDFPYPLYTFSSTLGTYSYSASFKEWIDKNVINYDVVIIHGLWQYHSTSASNACVENGIPYLLFTHGMLDPWFNQGKLLKALKKKVYWALFEGRVVNKADNVLFTSEEEKVLARKSFFSYSPKERVVAYGSSESNVEASLARINFEKQFPELSSKKFALFLSRVHEKKGIDMLIEALGALESMPDDFSLVIAGPDGNGLKAKLEKQVQRLGLKDRVVWLGMLSGDVKWGAYYSSDVFVLPSHQENFGIVVAEALSTSTPVLITNKINIWREIEMAGAGFVENDDVEGVGRLLKKWLSLPKSERQVMSSKAKACYVKNFSISSAADDLERVVLSVVE